MRKNLLVIQFICVVLFSYPFQEYTRMNQSGFFSPAADVEQKAGKSSGLPDFSSGSETAILQDLFNQNFFSNTENISSDHIFVQSFWPGNPGSGEDGEEGPGGYVGAPIGWNLYPLLIFMGIYVGIMKIRRGIDN